MTGESLKSGYLKARFRSDRSEECLASNPIGKSGAGLRKPGKKSINRAVYERTAGSATACLSPSLCWTGIRFEGINVF